MAPISRRHLVAIAGLLAGGALTSCAPSAQTETAPSPNAGDGDASQAQTGGEGAAAGTSQGEAVLSHREGEQLLVVAKVLDSPRLEIGSYVLVTFKTDEPSVQDVMVTLEKGDIITWTHLYPSDTSGYVSGWELAKGYNETGELLGAPLERFDG